MVVVPETSVAGAPAAVTPVVSVNGTSEAILDGKPVAAFVGAAELRGIPVVFVGTPFKGVEALSGTAVGLPEFMPKLLTGMLPLFVGLE